MGRDDRPLSKVTVSASRAVISDSQCVQEFTPMIVLTAYGVFSPEKVADGLEACKVIKGHSINEPGCERYDYYQNPVEPTRFVFVEEWTTMADLETHFATATFAEFMVTLEPCLSAPPEIRIFEAQLVRK